MVKKIIEFSIYKNENDCRLKANYGWIRLFKEADYEDKEVYVSNDKNQVKTFFYKSSKIFGTVFFNDSDNSIRSYRIPRNKQFIQ